MGGRSCTRALLPLLLLLAACGDGGSPSASPEATTTTRPETTSTTSTSLPDTTLPTGYDSQVECSVGGSSPSHYDPAGGQYAVHLTDLDVPERSVSFDVIQFLVGDDAVDAYHRDVPDDPEGPPNGYYIVNQSQTVRSAAVDTAVTVRLVRLREDGNADLDAGTFDELPTYLVDYQLQDEPWLSANPFWLTLHDGAVTDICEQYVP